MDLKIFTQNVEPKTLNHIYHLMSLKEFKNSKVRIMPDVHGGNESVIGFTSVVKDGDGVIPNIVGGDIGCGVSVTEFGKCDIDFAKFDEVVKNNVPAGRNLHEFPKEENKTRKLFESLKCYEHLRNKNKLLLSLGTLGGGNHFIELATDDEKNVYLLIHSGSKNGGAQVARYYQKLGIKQSKDNNDEKRKLIDRLKSEGREKDIQTELKKLSPNEPKRTANLIAVYGKTKEDYLHDLRIMQEFASRNRKKMAEIILKNYFDKFDIRNNILNLEYWESTHNYIAEDNIIRKGAISAYEGEKVVIPINMRDGSLIGLGKGNSEWNYSAPHGAGRLFSRTVAKQKITLEDFLETMKGVYTTTANIDTIDEAPMAYKPIKEILENVTGNVEITKHIKPIYNFKA